MNESWVVYGAPIALFVVFMVVKRLGQVSRERARALVKSGARLVDVRTTAEFQSGHLDGALNVPLQELAGKLNKLGAKDQPVVVYCASGTRSGMARSMLKRHGFSQVFNLGAMRRW